jgi:hypothetical protein
VNIIRHFRISIRMRRENAVKERCTREGIPTLPAGPSMLVPTRLASHKSVVERHLVLQHGVRSTRRARRSRLWTRIYRVVATSAEQSRRVGGAGGPHGSHAIQLPLEPVLLPLHQRRVHALLQQQQPFYISFPLFGAEWTWCQVLCTWSA